MRVAGHAVDEIRRRVQQRPTVTVAAPTNPPYEIHNMVRCTAERLTEKQQARLAAAIAIAANEPPRRGHVTWQCAQRLRATYAHPDLSRRHDHPEQVFARLPPWPIPEIARLGRTLKQWKDAFLAFVNTGSASNGETGAIIGLIELGRPTA